LAVILYSFQYILLYVKSLLVLLLLLLLQKNYEMFLISNFRCVLYVFFWVIIRASKFYMPTFQNTLSVPSL